MQTLLPSKQSVRSHPTPPATGLPPHRRRGFTRHTTFRPPLQPAYRVSYNVLFKPKVSCKFFADHGGLIRQLNSTRRLAPAKAAVQGLMLANVAVFLLWRVADENFMMQNFTLQLDNFYGRRYHTMITSAFSHVRVMHIVSNMIGLYIYGKRIEKLFGPEFLLKLYMVGAFFGSVSFLVHKAFLASSSKGNQLRKPDLSKAAGLGASGAVNAIMMLHMLLTPTDVSLFKFTIPLHALSAGVDIVEDIKRVKVEGFMRQGQNVARGIGKSQAKEIYNCADCTVESLYLFLKDEMDEAELEDLLFGFNDGAPHPSKPNILKTKFTKAVDVVKSSPMHANKTSMDLSCWNVQAWPKMCQKKFGNETWKKSFNASFSLQVTWAPLRAN
ncbi:hypothetical protein SSX86_000154 [Deinandra increscens subsp. villosa]|uniref:Peptidase S54 rhomboid domain-containing protein n=1 Tax=Deinandra increscens subsp. villosa TaxID=3103831 RepID=A0AAP0DSM3_9ASTR